MCKNLTIWWEDLDGKRLEMVPAVEYEMPPDFTPEQPTCTCWIGMTEGPGKMLRQHFVETVLRPMLDMAYIGRIVIEVF